MRRQLAAGFAVFPALLLFASVDARQQPVFRTSALAVRVKRRGLTVTARPGYVGVEAAK